MMGFEIKVERNRLPEVGRETHQRLGLVVKKTTFDVQGTAQDLIQEPHATGHIYIRGGIAHQASAPGEPPATDLGALVNSIQPDVSKAATTLRGEVNVGVEYGSHLEFGTVNMAARPFLEPALMDNRKPFEMAIEQALRKAAD